MDFTHSKYWVKIKREELENLDTIRDDFENDPWEKNFSLVLVSSGTVCVIFFYSIDNLFR